jgi:hypothetical protein
LNSLPPASLRPAFGIGSSSCGSSPSAASFDETSVPTSRSYDVLAGAGGKSLVFGRLTPWHEWPIPTLPSGHRG